MAAILGSCTSNEAPATPALKINELMGYNASKFGLTGFGESLFQELRKQGIKVTNVYPGSTATHFFDEIPGMSPHSHMINPVELASSILHVMDTSPNYLIREIEIRPLISKPPK